jgi:hypothetical protein
MMEKELSEEGTRCGAGVAGVDVGIERRSARLFEEDK